MTVIINRKIFLMAGIKGNGDFLFSDIRRKRK